jgi:hypothetical protein
MTENDDRFKADPTGALYGQMIALHGAIRALILTHPDRAAYQRVFHQEWKSALDFLSRTDSETALAVFRETSRTLDPVPGDGWKPEH